MTLTEDELWPVVVMFVIGVAVYLVGGMARVFGYPVEKRTLNALVGVGIVIVTLVYLVQPRLSGPS